MKASSGGGGREDDYGSSRMPLRVDKHFPRGELENKSDSKYIVVHKKAVPRTLVDKNDSSPSVLPPAGMWTIYFFERTQETIVFECHHYQPSCDNDEEQQLWKQEENETPPPPLNRGSTMIASPALFRLSS